MNLIFSEMKPVDIKIYCLVVYRIVFLVSDIAARSEIYNRMLVMMLLRSRKFTKANITIFKKG